MVSFVMMLVGGVGQEISYGINEINIGHSKIMEDMGTKNQVDSSHRASIGSFIIEVDVARIL